MKTLGCFAAALTIAMAVAGGASAANICQAENLRCPTSMPVDGYCECTSHGQTKGGTVVAAPAPHQHVNSGTGGCGSAPNSSGCR